MVRSRLLVQAVLLLSMIAAEWSVPLPIVAGETGASLTRRFDLTGTIRESRYFAPDGSFSVALHDSTAPWLVDGRPRRPSRSSYIPEGDWIEDERVVGSDHVVDSVTFWTHPEKRDPWYGYHAHRLLVFRYGDPKSAPAPDDLIRSLVQDRTRRYEAGAEEVRTELLHRERTREIGYELVREAYYIEREISSRVSVLFGGLVKQYSAYINACAFEMEPGVVVIAVNEIVPQVRYANERSERNQRVAHETCESAWLATLEIVEQRATSARRAQPEQDGASSVD